MRRSKQFTNKGLQVRSKFEATVINDLDERGVRYEYEPGNIGYDQPIKAGECLECGSSNVVWKRKYLPDIRLADGSLVEIKGYLKPDDRRTLIAFRNSHLKVKLRILFQSDRYLDPKTKATSYTDWARREGFDCHVGNSIPEEWIP